MALFLHRAMSPSLAHLQLHLPVLDPDNPHTGWCRHSHAHPMRWEPPDAVGTARCRHAQRRDWRLSVRAQRQVFWSTGSTYPLLALCAAVLLGGVRAEGPPEGPCKPLCEEGFSSCGVCACTCMLCMFSHTCALASMRVYWLSNLGLSDRRNFLSQTQTHKFAFALYGMLTMRELENTRQHMCH